jgi:hypothetical protein
MIALSIALFALLVVAWMVAPGDARPAAASEPEPVGFQPEGQRA